MRRAPGLTLNLPLPPGATGDVVRAALDEEARATMEEFAPDWVLVSCGFDAHRDDPLSNWSSRAATSPSWPASCASSRPGPGRLALFLEGGYDADGAGVVGGGDAGRAARTPRRTATAPTSGGPGLAELRAGDRAATRRDARD